MNIKWEEGAPAPVGLAVHIAIWLNGMVYVGGGNETGDPSYTINCYDPLNNSWRSPISTPYCHFAMTTLNNKLLIAGGLDEHYMKTDQILTMNAGQFKNYTKMITARSNATATGHQGMLIILGGQEDEHKGLSLTEIFDGYNGQWYKCDNLPRPHYCLQSVIVDNILYLSGGINKDGNSSPAVFAAPLDTLTRHQLKWSTNHSTPWCNSIPVVNGTHLLMIGGSKKLEYGYARTSDIYKLNKVDLSWEAIGHIPSARSLAAAVSTADNKIIVIGGLNDREEATNTIWIGSCEPQ